MCSVGVITKEPVKKFNRSETRVKQAPEDLKVELAKTFFEQF